MLQFDGAECGFGYRQSRFKGVDRDRFVILSLALRLTPDARPHLGYREVAERAGAAGVEELPAGQALTAVRRIVLELRRGKAMLRDPDDANARSVGSFFLNPVLTAGAFAALRAHLGARAEELPSYPAPEGIKVSAAWLIGAAGFRRGQTGGGVGISERHALALVNRGGSTAELLALAQEIRDGVAARFGVSLQMEPVIVAYDPRA
jgi:UDP-N-acetylmuramate dehydrogenase